MDQLEVLELLGSGAKSSTARCRCRLSGQEVAVKVYDKQVMKLRDCQQVLTSPFTAAELLRPSMKDASREQVAREIELHSRQQHPHILALYSAFEDLDGIYLVLEFAPGGNLFGALADAGGHLPEADVAVWVMRPLLTALAALHSQGVIHRDVKLENVLRDASGGLRLADFGLAIDSRKDEPRARVGTLDYFAPEVVDPADASGSVRLPYGSGVDVWAAGVVAYELLLGGPPFEADTKLETLRRILTEAPLLPRHWSRACRSFLTEALNKDPGRRPSAEKLLRHPWLAPPRPAG